MAMNNIFKGRWTVWILALTFALLAGFGSLWILGSAAERVNYYVVAENVAARTNITEAMVKTVSAPADAVPQNSVTAEEILSGNYYSKIELSAGTPLTDAVVTEGLTPLSAELPDGYVMASLIVNPENAAGGRISRGDLVDIAAVEPDSGTAKIVLHQVYVLDVTVAPDTVANNANVTTDTTVQDTTAGPSSADLYGGIPELYTFAVSRTDMLKLALIRNSQVYLALTNGGGTSGIDATLDSPTVFSSGTVQPSWNSKGSSTPSGVKSTVESWFTRTRDANSGSTFNIAEGKLVAYKADGTVIDSVDLAGGTFDVATGTYTAK